MRYLNYFPKFLHTFYYLLFPPLHTQPLIHYIQYINQLYKNNMIPDEECNARVRNSSQLIIMLSTYDDNIRAVKKKL